MRASAVLKSQGPENWYRGRPGTVRGHFRGVPRNYRSARGDCRGVLDDRGEMSAFFWLSCAQPRTEPIFAREKRQIYHKPGLAHRSCPREFPRSATRNVMMQFSAAALAYARQPGFSALIFSDQRREAAPRPSSLVVNTATRHLVVTGSIPIWVTTPQRRERWVPGSIPGSPRGLVKFGHLMGKGLYWDLNP